MLKQRQRRLMILMVELVFSKEIRLKWQAQHIHQTQFHNLQEMVERMWRVNLMQYWLWEIRLSPMRSLFLMLRPQIWVWIKMLLECRLQPQETRPLLNFRIDSVISRWCWKRTRKTILSPGRWWQRTLMGTGWYKLEMLSNLMKQED